MSSTTDEKIHREVSLKGGRDSTIYKLYCGVCSIFPQDASGEPPLFPRTSRICNWCSVICVMLAIWVHSSYEYADRRPLATIGDPSDKWFVMFTAVVGFTGLVYESFLAIAIHFMGLSDRYQQEMVFRRRLRLNRKMIFVFVALTVCYVAMFFDVEVVHRSWISDYYGGDQIVYGARYVEWVLGASMVVAINGQLDHTSEGLPRNGMVPSATLTGIYCIIAWQGLVVKNLYVAWILISFTFICYFFASGQQLMFAWSIKDKGCSGPLRACLIVYLVVVIGVYGVLYLLPIIGWMNPYLQHKCFCLGDASFKLWTSCMLCATNDVAANDELRRSAVASAADLARIIQTASVPIFGVDVESNITEWNFKTAELTGIPKEAAVGTPLIRMIGAASQKKFQTVMKKAFEGDEQLGHFETSFFPQDDEGDGKCNIIANKPMLMLSAAATKDSLGKVQGVTFVGCDLTEVSAFKEAEARKIRFMAIVSHELRSPLHGIIGLMDYFAEGEEDPKKQRYVTMVQNCAVRLLDLVVNIMEMASLVSSNSKDPALKLSRDPVELNKIVDEILVLVKNSYDKSGTKPLLKKGVDIFNKMEALPIIEADAHKCTQVLYNIITNACKFTMEGSITVYSYVPPETEWVEVSIADTGRGIEAASLERIFQPFEQSDSPVVRGHQGIGLGLSIALEVVKRHGGRIQVESQVGVGTTFTVRLPTVMTDENSVAPSRSLKEDEEDIEPPRTEVQKANTCQPAQLDQKKPVLLSVDDCAVNQEVVQHILGEICDVHVAMSGEEAIEYLRSGNRFPELILLDVMMPGMSGFDVCRIVRRELNISEISLPILISSASSTGATVAEALDAGANTYVFKAFDKDSLKAHVQSALRIKSLHPKRVSAMSAERFFSYASYSTDS